VSTLASSPNHARIALERAASSFRHDKLRNEHTRLKPLQRLPFDVTPRLRLRPAENRSLFHASILAQDFGSLISSMVCSRKGAADGAKSGGNSIETV
jgi:hypothetical protein